MASEGKDPPVVLKHVNVLDVKLLQVILYGRENMLNPCHPIHVIDRIDRSAYLTGKTVLVDVPKVARCFIGGRSLVGSDWEGLRLTVNVGPLAVGSRGHDGDLPQDAVAFECSIEDKTGSSIRAQVDGVEGVDSMVKVGRAIDGSESGHQRISHRSFFI